ncbi:SOS response-associated peptidase [Emcibacter sp.]|uniref:SOS response-associated peptidase n=1 Tax=Emcibacter sp. TaxID=1979954 RepID=UPI002AA89487|nr:SOS response-associated peptidase [Emcibacter sp.]
MCGRYSLASDAYKKFLEFMGLSDNSRVPSRFNVAPLQPIPVIRLSGSDRDQAIRPESPLPAKEVALMRWGLVPNWAKELQKGKPLINARSETIADKPSFRSPFRRRRCLIPADGFYEWKKSGASPVPYHICLPDHAPFAFAGIWEIWMGPHGEDWLETVSIVTKPATGKIRDIHNRMPVMPHPDDYDLWLRPADPPDRHIFDKLSTALEDRFGYYRVSPYVNSARHDGPVCREPATDPEEDGRGQFGLF